MLYRNIKVIVLFGILLVSISSIDSLASETKSPAGPPARTNSPLSPLPPSFRNKMVYKTSPETPNEHIVKIIFDALSTFPKGLKRHMSDLLSETCNFLGEREQGEWEPKELAQTLTKALAAQESAICDSSHALSSPLSSVSASTSASYATTLYYFAEKIQDCEAFTEKKPITDALIYALAEGYEFFEPQPKTDLEKKQHILKFFRKSLATAPQSEQRPLAERTVQRYLDSNDTEMLRLIISERGPGSIYSALSEDTQFEAKFAEANSHGAKAPEEEKGLTNAVTADLPKTWHERIIELISRLKNKNPAAYRSPQGLVLPPDPAVGADAFTVLTADDLQKRDANGDDLLKFAVRNVKADAVKFLVPSYLESRTLSYVPWYKESGAFNMVGNIFGVRGQSALAIAATIGNTPGAVEIRDVLRNPEKAVAKTAKQQNNKPKSAADSKKEKLELLANIRAIPADQITRHLLPVPATMMQEYVVAPVTSRSETAKRLMSPPTNPVQLVVPRLDGSGTDVLSIKELRNLSKENILDLASEIETKDLNALHIGHVSATGVVLDVFEQNGIPIPSKESLHRISDGRDDKAEFDSVLDQLTANIPAIDSNNPTVALPQMGATQERTRMRAFVILNKEYLSKQVQIPVPNTNPVVTIPNSLLEYANTYVEDKLANYPNTLHSRQLEMMLSYLLYRYRTQNIPLQQAQIDRVDQNLDALRLQGTRRVASMPSLDEEASGLATLPVVPETMLRFLSRDEKTPETLDKFVAQIEAGHQKDVLGDLNWYLRIRDAGDKTLLNYAIETDNVHAVQLLLFRLPQLAVYNQLSAEAKANLVPSHAQWKAVLDKFLALPSDDSNADSKVEDLVRTFSSAIATRHRDLDADIERAKKQFTDFQVKSQVEQIDERAKDLSAKAQLLAKALARHSQALSTPNTPPDALVRTAKAVQLGRASYQAAQTGFEDCRNLVRTQNRKKEFTKKFSGKSLTTKYFEAVMHSRLGEDLQVKRIAKLLKLNEMRKNPALYKGAITLEASDLVDDENGDSLLSLALEVGDDATARVLQKMHGSLRVPIGRSAESLLSRNPVTVTVTISPELGDDKLSADSQTHALFLKEVSESSDDINKLNHVLAFYEGRLDYYIERYLDKTLEVADIPGVRALLDTQYNGLKPLEMAMKFADVRRVKALATLYRRAGLEQELLTTLSRLVSTYGDKISLDTLEQFRVLQGVQKAK